MTRLHAIARVIALTTGLAFSIVLMVIAYNSIMQDEESALGQDFGILRGNLVEKMSAAQEVLHSLKLQFDLSVVDADQFRILAEDALQLHPYIKSVKYFPLVTSDERKDFEKSQQADGYSSFSITEKSGNGYIPAGPRPRYYPLIFQEPFNPEMAQSMGEDALTNLDLLPFIEAAIDTAAPIQAVTPAAYRIIKATYAGKEESRITHIEERRKLANGILQVELDATQLLTAKNLNDLSSLTLTSTLHHAASTTVKILDYTADQQNKDKWSYGTLSGSRVIDVGDNQFKLSVLKYLHFKSAHFLPVFWALLGGALVTTLLYLLASSISAKAESLEQRNQEIQHIVEEKTRELAFERDRAQVTLESLAEAVITTDNHGVIEYINPVAEKLSGWLAKDAVGRSIFDTFKVVADQTLEEIPSAVQFCLDTGEVIHRQENAVLLSKDGNNIAVNESAAPIFDLHGKITGVVLIFHDVSVMRSLTLQVYHQATHDSLTGLPNRLLLKDRIDVELNRARRENQKIAVLFLDLDRFKLVNDSLGHAVGDELLKQVASRFTACARDTDIVSRLGGDEFVIVMSELDDSSQASVLAERLLKSLLQPFTHDEYEFFIGASIGISIYPDSGQTSEDLMTNADIAMYRVKEQGKNSYLFYSTMADERGKPQLSLEAELRYAIERNELVLHYQPQVDAQSGNIIGVEALVRWNHPATGMIPPNQFIPLAEESGLIEDIGCWVMKEACLQNKKWQDMGLPVITMAVNLAHRQFLKSNLIAKVQQILTDTGLQGRYLDIELTEGVLAENPLKASAKLLELKALGVQLSIDDFGTGYSSLAYLKDFPIDTVKIDRCFVKDIETVKKDAEICMAIISMTHSMNLKVVAEGVETEAQLEFLRNGGCDIIQGFYFSKPLTASAAENFLRLSASKT